MAEDNDNKNMSFRRLRHKSESFTSNDEKNMSLRQLMIIIIIINQSTSWCCNTVINKNVIK